MADIFIKIDGIAGESQDTTHRDEIEVLGSMRKVGGLPLEYLKITMFDAIETRVEPAAGAGLTLEHVALSCARMKKEYGVQSATGGGQGTVTALIDVKQNTAGS